MKKKTKAKVKYEQFLATRFWRRITNARREVAGGYCEKCGAKGGHKCYHIFTRPSLFLTYIDDVRILCDRCKPRKLRAIGHKKKPVIVRKKRKQSRMGRIYAKCGYPKKAYQAFLDTKFWLNLRTLKIELVGGKCEKCGSRFYLQCHHLFYRPDWFDTKLEDLQVLCRNCHRQEHYL